MSLKPAELRDQAHYFANFPSDRGFLAWAMADEDARVYVDDPQSPRVILLANSPVSFVWGDSSLARAVAEQLLQHAAGSDWPSAILSGEASWTQTFPAGGIGAPWRFPRVDYDLDSRSPAQVAPLDARLRSAFNILPIEGDLIERTKVECGSEFDERMFRKHQGIGFEALDRGRIIANAWTVIIGGCTNIGFETLEKYRGRGLASHLGAKVLENCRALGAQLHLTTGQGNAPARACAKRMGFAVECLHDWAVFQMKP